MLRLQAESGVTAGVTHVTGGNYTWIWVVAIVGLLALGVAFALVREVLAADQGTSNMRTIAAAVQEGASAYLKRQGGQQFGGGSRRRKGCRQSASEFEFGLQRVGNAVDGRRQRRAGSRGDAPARREPQQAVESASRRDARRDRNGFECIGQIAGVASKRDLGSRLQLGSQRLGRSFDGTAERRPTGPPSTQFRCHRTKQLHDSVTRCGCLALGLNAPQYGDKTEPGAAKHQRSAKPDHSQEHHRSRGE
jgi:hypothetical protein